MKTLISLTAAVGLLCACSAPPPKQPQATAAKPDYIVPDDSAITQAVKNAYAAISYNNDKVPSTAHIDSAFIPEAQLINFRAGIADVTSLQQFDKLYTDFVTKAKIKLFYEEEIFGRTEQFGKIAHRISTYTTYFNTRDSVAERGVNSFQLIKTPKGWKVSSIIWDVEKPDLKVPDYYLKK